MLVLSFASALTARGSTAAAPRMPPLSRVTACSGMSEWHEQWMVEHNRVYVSEGEKAHRLEVFKRNVEFIHASNARSALGHHGYRLRVNAFSDLTSDEFRAGHNGFRLPKAPPTKGPPGGFKYGSVSMNECPPSLDWRTKGAVNPIKDQGQCGSCWAFSTVAAVEGITKIANGTLVSLSEQELMDCDKGNEDDGCTGGYMDNAFQFIIKNKGLAKESAYPYTAVVGKCAAGKTAAATIKGFQDVPKYNESALLVAVAHQPVAVGIDAGCPEFQSYSSGVLTKSCGTALNHGVVVVGYGTTADGTKYWLVRNSWGTQWGEKGYFKLLRDVKDKDGTCGITMMASFPTA